MVPNMLAFLQQEQQRVQAQNPYGGLAEALGSFANDFQQGRDRQWQARERQQQEQQWAQGAQDRQHKLDLEQLEAFNKAGKGYMGQGQPQAAFRSLEASRGLRQKLGYPVGPGSVDYNNPSSVGDLAAALGYEPKLTARSVGEGATEYITDQQGNVIRKLEGAPKSNHYSAVPGMPGWAFDKGSGSYVNTTPTAPKMTPYQQGQLGMGKDRLALQKQIHDDAVKIAKMKDDTQKAVAVQRLVAARRGRAMALAQKEGITLNEADLNADDAAYSERLIQAIADAPLAAASAKPTPAGETTQAAAVSKRVGEAMGRVFGPMWMDVFSKHPEMEQYQNWLNAKERGKPVGKAPITREQVNAIKAEINEVVSGRAFKPAAKGGAWTSGAIHPATQEILTAIGLTFQPEDMA